MAADEIMHHVYEVLIRIAAGMLIVVHHGFEHQEHVSALGVRDALVGLAGLRRYQPAGLAKAVPRRSRQSRRCSSPGCAAFAGSSIPYSLFAISPPVASFQKKACGEIGKSFREPLVMIRGPAYAVAKPLVGDFVRGHFLNKSGEVGVDGTK